MGRRGRRWLTGGELLLYRFLFYESGILAGLRPLERYREVSGAKFGFSAIIGSSEERCTLTVSRKKKNYSILFTVGVLLMAGWMIYQKVSENAYWKLVVERFSAESRRAEIIVTDFNPVTTGVTLKWLEYDSLGNAMEPKYFTFKGNQVQFESLVVRFDDEMIKKAANGKDRSIALFLRAFRLDPKETEIQVITEAGAVPEGYRVDGVPDRFQQQLWEDFWMYANSPQARKDQQIKNVQLEAPGTRFLPGNLYTIYIEHDGGLRVDSARIPSILKGEKIRHD